ncbi:MAG: DUF1552 domain-containing protein [Verrucomicrobia bacterium]|nr:DUF1552 domain-containing protein [Verrucomicrobiota bacterium]
MNHQPSNRHSVTAAQRPDHRLTRRRFLRGLGACLALPAFESLRPLSLQAGTTAAGALGTTPTGAPLRMAYIYFPNGANQDYWWPNGEGADFTLGRTMQPLEGLKDRIQVIAGLDHRNATAGDDGAGDHARANGTFLTGVRVRKTAGADIQAGESIDQVVARQVGHLTRFPSLELSCDAVRKSGNCDSGYSCAYQFNLAWRSPTLPLAPEPNPRLVFERLFGGGSAATRRDTLQLRKEQQRSILDFVLEDARSLQRQLASRDRLKLDEYLESVRAIETRIERAEQLGDTPDPGVDTPAGIPTSYEEHLRLMFSMLALAFQTDSTRVATFLLAHDGSNRAFPDIGAPEGHHHLSHHGNQADMKEKIGEIDRWYARQFAWFLNQLNQTTDVDGNSLLHNSMIVYGCGNADGNRHTHHNLPIILAGNGGGSLNPGRYLRLPPTPATNLFLGMADRFGIQDLEHFGDSTGRLADL